MNDTERNVGDLLWCEKIGTLVADELAIANLLTADQLDWAAEIVAQQIHVCLVSGLRPPNSN